MAWWSDRDGKNIALASLFVKSFFYKYLQELFGSDSFVRTDGLEAKNVRGRKAAEKPREAKDYTTGLRTVTPQSTKMVWAVIPVASQAR
jgi:hypothetical protein